MMDLSFMANVRDRSSCILLVITSVPLKCRLS